MHAAPGFSNHIHMCLLQLLPFIIGRSGNTKKQIEQETGTTLLIPKGGCVV